MSRLLSYTHTAAEIWAEAVVFGLWWVQEKEGDQVGLRWLVSANTNTCGVRTGEICKRFIVALLATGIFIVKSC